jgi:tetrapyrrole methylase family protein/MazG family protein
MVYSEITDPFRRLVRIMERLQEPGGCPWDIEQTHESLKPYLIEETYEAIDAIDSGNWNHVEEELGDVLLQVIFHSVLAQRTGKFSIDDVTRTAAAKMVHRHPHVFGDAEARTADDVLKNWEKLKQKEREAKSASTGHTAPASLLANVPRTLPALLRAQRLQEKAARVGFDWPDSLQVLDKVEEEIRELREALKSGNESHAREELGDLLFSIVNLTRFLKADAEDALSGTSEKFRRRFQFIESKAREHGRDTADLSLEEMETFWQQAKELEK